MTLAHIAVFAVVAILYGALLPAQFRGWAILALSVVAAYWLQPLLPIRSLDFALPTATVILTVACWWLTRPPESRFTRDDGLALALIAALILGLSLMRDVRAEFRLTPSRPPQPLAVIGVLAVLAALGLILSRGLRVTRWRPVLTAMIGLIVVLFVILKTEPFGVAASAFLRSRTGQQTELASILDLRWLGFSYVAFRLIHTLRDRQTGRLPALSLREYASYVLFFPALTAGPIDRAERFVKDYRALPEASNAPSRAVVGFSRIAVGLIKKFVIADTLALIALGPALAAQAGSAIALWGLLYAYAFRLYLDFSGYTDIAIGIGILYGINLPENFDRPYTRQNIAAFWQSWHITLSNWARFYVFSPLSRALLTRKPKPSPLLVVFAAQIATMLTIGLWHGVALNFVLWGIWHGVGLFAHKVWSDRTRPWQLTLPQRPTLRRAWTVAGVLLTFHFVALGWVWFALSDAGAALATVGRLFGLGW